MKKMAVLGPSGTYSDVAARAYLQKNNIEAEIVYLPTIIKTAQEASSDVLAIVPFENTLDGFVVESLDTIIKNKCRIVDQVKLDIDFAFVTNAKSIDDVHDVYVQFKALGQCLDFTSEHDFNLLRTQSNSETVNLIKEAPSNFGAIIPIHSLKDLSFNIVKLHVADSINNETRFFILDNSNKSYKLNDDVEASLVITAFNDKPGLLFEILKSFHELNINLKSIISRPMKTEIGHYKFYIECQLKKENVGMIDQIREQIKQNCSLDLLGVYNSL